MNLKSVSDLCRELTGDDPQWLGEEQILDWGVSSHPSEDGYTVRGTVFNKQTYSIDRSATCFLSGFHISRAPKGMIVDMVAAAVDDVLDRLAPDPLAESFMNLILEAHQDEQALGVLVDALLEEGQIKPYRRSIPRRADTRTDDEKAAAERADLRKKALAWAKPHVELLFRRNWSVVPWGPDTPERRVIRAAHRSFGTYEVTFPRPWPLGR